jgi:hypothetical protein
MTLVCNIITYSLLIFEVLCYDESFMYRYVHEFLILARTWFAFGLPSKTGCDIGEKIRNNIIKIKIV